VKWWVGAFFLVWETPASDRSLPGWMNHAAGRSLADGIEGQSCWGRRDSVDLLERAVWHLFADIWKVSCICSANRAFVNLFKNQYLSSWPDFNDVRIVMANRYW